MIPAVQRLKQLVPRSWRNAFRAPKQTLRALEQSWSYRRGHSVQVEVRPDWQVRCHPASVEAFRAHAEIESVREELDGFLRFVTPSMTLLDIGSHHGVFTLAALRYGGPEAFVIAVDPSHDINPIFRANIALSRASDRIFLLEAAVGASDGQLHMLSTNAAGDRMFVASPPRGDTFRIEMLSVPSIVEKAGRIPTHVKIDVEGFEDEVIRGAERFLAQHKPVVFLELHSAMMRSSGRSPRQPLAILAALKYSFESQGKPLGIEQAVGEDLCRLIARPA